MPATSSEVGLTPSALRREAGRGNLDTIRIANKDFVTRRTIEEMKERCRRSARHDSGSATRSAPVENPVPSGYIVRRQPPASARDALLMKLKQAGRKLAEYIASKHQIPGSTHAKEVMLSDVLSLYLEVKAEGTSDPKLTMQILRRLAVFWGDKTVSQIIGPNCRAYTKGAGDGLLALVGTSSSSVLR